MTGLLYKPIVFDQSYNYRDIAYQIKGNEKQDSNLCTKITETAMGNHGNQKFTKTC
jgi:cytochrome c551/c552